MLDLWKRIEEWLKETMAPRPWKRKYTRRAKPAPEGGDEAPAAGIPLTHASPALDTNGGFRSDQNQAEFLVGITS